MATVTRAATIHPIEPYAMARLTETARNLTGGRASWPAGMKFLIDDYVPAEESEDGRAFYWGSALGGSGNVAFYADVVALEMTRAQVEDRRPPTPAEIIRALRLLDDYDTFETDESDTGGMPEGAAEVVGTTSAGLRFAFTVTISDVREVDF